MEKLIPFDFEAFKADPSRLRRPDGSKAKRASVALNDAIAVMWDGDTFAHVYLAQHFSYIRLAAKTRIVRVRVFRILGTGAISVATNATGANLDAPGVYPWISDPVEIEITE